MIAIPTVIVGIGFRGAEAKAAVAKMREGDGVVLEREPQNRHDPLAVACYYLFRHVGYIPRQANPKIAAALDAGLEVACVVSERPVVQGSVIRVEPKITVSWEDSRC